MSNTGAYLSSTMAIELSTYSSDPAKAPPRSTVTPPPNLTQYTGAITSLSESDDDLDSHGDLDMDRSLAQVKAHI